VAAAVTVAAAAVIVVAVVVVLVVQVNLTFTARQNLDKTPLNASKSVSDKSMACMHKNSRRGHTLSLRSTVLPPRRLI
jgi:uncharacterized protein with FMN-binding domain